MEYLLLNGNDILQTLDNVEQGMGSVSGILVFLEVALTSLAGILGLGIPVLIFIISVISSIIGLLIGLIEYLLPAIALFKLARKAGYKHAWLAFIPVAQTYLEFVLPRREFNLLFKTKNRSLMGIIDLILTYFGTTIIVALNVIPALGQLLDVALPFILVAFAWRRKYDMICTFRDKELALLISILSIPFPFVYNIVLIFSMNREPEYGAGNYYNVPMEDKKKEK